MRQGQAGKAGAYFVTIVTQDRACLFGHIVDGEMRLNAYGKIVRAEWFKTAQVRPYVVLHEDEFVVMPNHIHGIIWIVDDVGARRRRAPTVEQFGKPVPGSIPTIIRAFKSAVTQRINGLQGTSGGVVWQRNYYEHIIRDEESLNSRGTAAPCPYFDRENPCALPTETRGPWQMRPNSIDP